MDSIRRASEGETRARVNLAEGDTCHEIKRKQQHVWEHARSSASVAVICLDGQLKTHSAGKSLRHARTHLVALWRAVNLNLLAHCARHEVHSAVEIAARRVRRGRTVASLRGGGGRVQSGACGAGRTSGRRPHEHGGGRERRRRRARGRSGHARRCAPRGQSGRCAVVVAVVVVRRQRARRQRGVTALAAAAIVHVIRRSSRSGHRMTVAVCKRRAHGGRRRVQIGHRGGGGGG